MSFGKKSFFVTVLTVAAILGCAVNANAQGEKQQKAAQKSDTHDVSPVDLTPDPHSAKNGVPISFVTTSYSNVIKLMWKMGVFKVDNKSDIESYIKISECNLYLKYFKDDFEWRKIQTATKSYLEKYSPEFSNFFEIVQPLKIDRYDFDLKGFTLDPPNELVSVSALQMYSMQGAPTTECGNISIGDPKYTGSAILRLKSPINIGYIRIAPELAKEYLHYVEDNQGHLERKIAYIRYRVRIDRYMATESVQSIGVAQVFSGKVLEVNIFADREMFLPLFSQSYE